MTPRPTVTHEIKLAAALEVAKNIDGDAETIASMYRHPMDGYELAQQLEIVAGWHIDMHIVEELDTMSSLVRNLLTIAEKEWVEKNDIKPQLEIGTKITQGIIEGISDHCPAHYLVKQNGCTIDKRWLLVKFENAVPA